MEKSEENFSNKNYEGKRKKKKLLDEDEEMRYFSHNKILRYLSDFPSSDSISSFSFTFLDVSRSFKR